jgi:hypothetical protein
MENFLSISLTFLIDTDISAVSQAAILNAAEANRVRRAAVFPGDRARRRRAGATAHSANLVPPC